MIVNHRVRVIRNEHRVGVAYCRDVGSREARGDVLCYLDAHQRVSKGGLDLCAQVALDRGAIACPDIRDYGLFKWRLHGASFCLCPDRGYFSADWRLGFARRRVSPVTGLRAPPYLIPRALYPKVAWSPALRGWGASEASVVVKSFFTGIPIFHLAGPLAHHRFQRTFLYPTSWQGVWRNQAIIARVCFDDATWVRHWLPRVFATNLSEESQAIIESAEVLREHELFLSNKVKTDRQFFAELARTDPPTVV